VFPFSESHQHRFCYTKKVSSFCFYIGIIGFAVGVAAASLFDIGFAYVAWMVMFAGAFGLIARARGEAPCSGNLAFVSIFLVTCVLGMIRFEFAAIDEISQIYETQIDQEVILEGVVVREPDIREKTIHLYVRVEDELLLVTTHRYTDVSYGDRIIIEGHLKKPGVFETDLSRTFNYPGYLHARGVSYVVSFAEVATLEKDAGNIFISKILKVKQLFMQSIEEVLPEPQVGLAEGLLLGVKQALGDELEEVFRKTGIIHIVVLSGYNVMLVVIFITYVLSYILPYKARVPFGIASIICFAVLVGLSATVVRASIMAALILFARSTGRTYAVMRALCFAGIIMILINPYLLVYDVGFQLSFLATLGLIFLATHIEQRLQFMPTLLGMREFLTATLATQIFVMPILLYQIGELSIVSVIVNVLVLPMVPIAMLLTFITGLVGLVSVPVAVLIGFVTHISLSYILIVATFFAGVPFASFAVPTFPFWVVIIGYAFLGYVLYRLQKKPKTTSSSSPVVSGWVIEEEQEVEKRLAAEEQSSSAANHTSISFR
jgi:competence protein ComEC